MPDLRPSNPLSCGPTLFLAPSPIAWQAKHLLNDVLPAAASCASAAEATADDAMTISALSISFLIVCSSCFRGDDAVACCTRGSRRTSHERVSGLIGPPADPFGLPKAVQTCLIRRDKSTGADALARRAAAGRSTREYHDARIGPGRSGTPRRHRGGVARDRAGRGRDRQRSRNAALRVR